MSKVIFKNNEFQSAKKITWNDVVDKIEVECKCGVGRTEINDNAPTIVCNYQFFPTTIKNAYEEVAKFYDVKGMNMYISFGSVVEPFGRHRDKMSILVVQAIGTMSYGFDDNIIHTLNPGDSLFIPVGVSHRPIRHANKRVTLSFLF
jgi:ribosomal protein L16 Arg81 hydroxylase